MATKKYWKGLEELNNSPEFVKHAQNEFAEPVPVDEFLDNKNLSESNGTNRRDFLKFLGFSVTAASLAACETPVNKAIPYVVKPDEITPGVANWYASTYYDGNDYASVIVKTREGRPIKIEGNDLSKVSMGGTNARVQASILSLYDSSRLAGPTAKGAKIAWDKADKEIIEKLNAVAASGATIGLLSSSIISPSTKAAIAEFSVKYPTTKHVAYDAVSYSGIAKANANSFGKEVVPSYRFDKADVIVSIAADFLANWLSPIEYAAQYAKTRKVGKDKKSMSKHIQFESNLSLTGANADERTPVKFSEQGKVAVNLYNAIAKIVGGSGLPFSSLPCDAAINKVAKLLAGNKTKSLVVAGSNDVNVQMVVNGINQLLESYGNTIDLNTPNYTHQSDDAAFTQLVSDMAAGKVGAIITYNTNPIYTAPAALEFEKAYKKVGLKISFADRADETASLANYICPDSNYLESWNDFNPKKGQYSLSQPTIKRLFDTRQAQQSLLTWSGNATDYVALVQKTWAGIRPMALGMEGKATNDADFWNQSLHDGVVEVTPAVEAVAEVVSASVNLGDAAQKINAVKGGAFELALYEKVGIGNGNQANNPWLQELPDPISKITWDNYVTMSPLDMRGKYNMMERQDREASVVKVTVGSQTIELPVVPQPGQAQGTIGIAVGYGRDKAGLLSERTENKGGIGKNAFPFAQVAEGALIFGALNVTVADAGKSTEIAGTQIHHTLMGRDIVKETTLEEYKINPKSGNPDKTLVTHSGVKKVTDVDLWDSFGRPGHKWGMTIDLNSCIGCGGCVVSCTAENNVGVVGKAQVINTRELHWLRIDRYYSSDMTKESAEKDGTGAIDMYLKMENPTEGNPQVVFQPVMCQHCNHAPCENVCPVLATNHSSDGLNMMTYNRCVGTRYCANNCPFKVRRFNWFNYNENPDYSFNPSQDDLSRMVLNPDVVVRSRGVMEKCSMCIQRIQEGKLDAKKAGAPLKDGAIKTACQQSCPTNAIYFGDLNDENSEVSKLRQAGERNYFMLEEIGVNPTVSYLTKVRNVEPTTKPKRGAGQEHKKEAHHG